MSRSQQQSRRVDTQVDAQYGIDVSKLDAAVLWRITAMAFRHRLRMAVAIFATLCAGSFQLLVPQYLGRAVDQARGLLAGAAAGEVARSAAEDALFTTAMLLLGAAIARGSFTMLQNYQGEAVGQLIGSSRSACPGTTGCTPAT